MTQTVYRTRLGIANIIYCSHCDKFMDTLCMTLLVVLGVQNYASFESKW